MYGFEQRARENEENVSEDRGIRSRRARRVLLFTDNLTNTDTYTNNNYSNNADQKEHVTLIRYLEQSDFRRGIIKGSMRAQRRKTVTYELFQANAHSPLFLDRIKKPFLFSFDISGLRKVIFRNWMWKKKDQKPSDYDSRKERAKKKNC